MTAHCADCNKRGKLGNNLKFYVVRYPKTSVKQVLCFKCYQKRKPHITDKRHASETS